MRALIARLRELEPRWILLALMGVGLVLRLVYSLTLPDEFVFGDASDYWACSENLLAGNGFSLQPFDARLAHVPPLYPVFLAGAKLVGARSLDAIRVAQALLAVGLIPLMYAVGRAAFPPRVMAGMLLLYALSVNTIYWTGMIATELLALALFTLAYLAYARGLVQDRNSWLALSTVLLGLAVLTRAVFVFVFPVFLLGLLLERRRWFVRCLGLSALLAAVLLPWTVRNYVLFDRLVPVSLGAGRVQVLKMAAFSEDYADVLEHNAAMFEREHARYVHPKSPAEEYEADRALTRLASEMRWAHPATTARLCVYNFLRFWSPGVTLLAGRFRPVAFIASFLFGGLLFPLIAVGLHRLMQRNRTLFIVTALILLYFTALHTLLIGMLRYRFVLDGILYLLAALGFAGLVGRFRARRLRIRSP